MTRQKRQIGPAGLKPHTVARDSVETLNVRFSPAQLQWLEAQFPERVLPATASEAELRHYFGQRSVINAVRDKVRL